MNKKYVTLKEIEQQKKLWLDLLKNLDEKKDIINNFFKNIDYKNRKIIFTGAGTSEFVGNSIVHELEGNFNSIATTDIVSNPDNYFKKNEKVLLVSFARSGNSPESVATVNLADQIIDDVCHILISCNPEGKLATIKKNSKQSLVLLMPEESNDKGFAMTSSFTCMTLAGMTIFNLDKIDRIKKIIKELINIIDENEVNMRLMLDKIIPIDLERIIYLGSSTLKGLAEEASLKCLELTGGNMSLHYNSPLGFRHGPKSIVNDKTMIITLLSNDEYTRKYEIDLLKEMFKEKGDKKLVTLDMFNSEVAANNSHYYFAFDSEKFKGYKNIFNLFSYVYFAQLFAFYKSLAYGINPDNPCPTGEVNRVVQGVNIHPYN